MALTPEQARQLADAVAKIEKSVSSTDRTIEQMLRSTGTNLQALGTELEKIGRVGVKGMQDFGKEGDKTVTLLTSKWVDFTTKVGQQWDGVTKKLDELERHPAMKSLFGNPDQAGLLSGKTGGMAAGLDALKDSVMSGIPYGGLIGLLMAGGKQDIEFKMMSNRAVNIFQSTSMEAGKSAGYIGSRMKDLKEQLGITAEEFGSTFSALAAGGVTSGEALGQMAGAAHGFGESISEALMAADALFKLPQGGAAQLTTKIVQDTGVSIQDATNSVYRLGEAARGTGANIGVFLGTLTQAASALRMQKTDVNDLSAVYFGLADSIKKANPTANAAYIAKGAQGALTGLAGGMAGLGDGAKAYLAQKMGMSGSGTDLLYQFDTAGKGDKSAGFLIKAVTSLQDIAKQAVGGKEADQYAFYQKSAFHLSKEVAQSLLEFQGGKYKGMSSDELTKKFPELIEAVKGQRLKEQDPFVLLAEQIKSAIAALGSLILAALMALVRTVLSVGMATVNAFKGGSLKDSLSIIDANARISGSSLSKSVASLGSSFSNIGLGNIGETFDLTKMSPEAAKAFLGPEKPDPTLARHNARVDQKSTKYTKMGIGTPTVAATDTPEGRVEVLSVVKFTPHFHNTEPSGR